MEGMMAIYEDMSVSACLARYDARRAEILERIAAGFVSASMSGIEYYMCPSEELLEKDIQSLESSLRWDGEKTIDRPRWLAEYMEFVGAAE